MPELLPGLAEADLNEHPQARPLHYDLLKSRIPAWYNGAIAHRQQELDDHQLHLPDWYLEASHQTKASLKASHVRYRETLNQVDSVLGNIQDIRAFAKPLLIDAIQQRFKLEVDVEQTYFARQYGLKKRTDLGWELLHRLTGEAWDTTEYRGTSLLETALANFGPDEVYPLDCDDCHLVTTTSPSANGALTPTLASIRAGALPIAPHVFARICRHVDFGRRYQEHIGEILRPTDKRARDRLDSQLREHHRQSLALSTELAWSKKDIGHDTYQMLQRVIRDQPAVELDGRAVTFDLLNVLGVSLVGPLLIGPDRKSSNYLQRVVAYIPGDPEYPLKEYASSALFMADLRRRLHGIAYRRFFSRFVPLNQQGHFFKAFDRLYQPSPKPDEQADYPLKPALSDLPMTASSVSGSLWEALRREQLDKIEQDARVVAVPTADADKAARLERVESWTHTVVDVLNQLALVVPVLGPLMLFVGAAQMCDEAFEGIEAFEQGERKEMWAHFSSVALNAAFMAGGAKLIPKIEPSDLVDQMRPVKRANGESRLWRPDLKPYESRLELPAGSVPDAQGLHRIAGKTLLPIEGKLYEVQQDSATERYRIAHPSRPDAYQPDLTHNGSGGWNHQLESPQRWQGATLMRRLGHRVEPFSDAELERIRIATGTEEDTLRRMHVEGEPTPVLLNDTINRFIASRRVDEFIRRLNSADPLDYANIDPLTPVHLLTRHGEWPQSLRLKVVNEAGETRWQFPDSQQAGEARRDVVISETKLLSSSWAENLVAAADASGVDLLEGSGSWLTTTQKAARTLRLREKLAQIAERRRLQLIGDQHALLDASSDPRVVLIKSRYPSVPAAAIERLMAYASPMEIEQMSGWDFSDAFQIKRIPLRIAEELRHLQRNVRLNRAYEGLFNDTLATPDTPRLALATLQALPGWSDTVRIELRENFASGTLIDSIGPPESTQVKIVARHEGRYKAFDTQGNELSSWTDLYDALQHALPDDERAAMGRPASHQGEDLRQAISASAVDRSTLASRLKMQPVRPFFKSPMRVAAGKVGYPLSGLGKLFGRSRSEPAHLRRIEALYPSFTESETRRFLLSLGNNAPAELNRLETELQTLNSDLDRWVARSQLRAAGPDFVVSVPLETRQVVAGEIRRCWRRQTNVVTTADGVRAGYELNLGSFRLGTLPDLSADFSHVASLRLNNTAITQDVAEAFLSRFSSLRWLDLSGNRFTELPAALGSMNNLTKLYLRRNQIRLTPQTIDILASRSRLKVLDLSHNPVGQLPDFTGLPELRAVFLSHTGISSWPSGLRDQPLDVLDLRANQLTQVPEALVDPTAYHGRAMARINGRTLLQGNPLSEQTQVRLRDYWASIESQHADWQIFRFVGAFMPEAARPIRAASVERWLEGVPEEQLAGRKALWQGLMNEPQSHEFFQLLDRLEQSYRGEEAYPDLRERVWQMLEAIHGSTELREELFSLAGEPTCVDRAALSFSYLEIRLMIHNARMMAAGEDEAFALLKLAKGLFRVDEVERIAYEYIQQRYRRGDVIVDEVEVRLAYRVGLTDRLELPGQPKRGHFLSLGDVTQDMLDAAAVRVEALKDSTEERQSILGRDFWVDHIKRRYPQRFEALNDALIDSQLELDEAKANGTLDESTHASRSEALGLQQRIKEAELVQSLTQDELDPEVESTDL